MNMLNPLNPARHSPFDFAQGERVFNPVNTRTLMLSEVEARARIGARRGRT